MTCKYPASGYIKDHDALHLYVRDVRILTPQEYEKLKAVIPKESHKTIFDILIITGIRYAELLGFTSTKSGTTKGEISFTF